MNLTLIVRTWRNRYQGSEMHSVEIVRDGHFVAKLKPLLTEPVELGVDWLEVSGLIPRREAGASFHHHLNQLNPRPYITSVNVANKSDL